MTLGAKNGPSVADANRLFTIGAWPGILCLGASLRTCVSNAAVAASIAAGPLMAEHRFEHDKVDQYEDEAEHSRRSDRSTVRTVWRSLNSPATPNQVVTIGVSVP